VEQPWRLSSADVLVGSDLQHFAVLSARVTHLLVQVRVRPLAGGRSRSLLFHSWNTPEPGFRRLRTRLRWGRLGSGDSPVRGNLPAEPVSQSLTHGASGEPHGGLGIADTRDR